MIQSGLLEDFKTAEREVARSADQRSVVHADQDHRAKTSIRALGPADTLVQRHSPLDAFDAANPKQMRTQPALVRSGQAEAGCFKRRSPRPIRTGEHDACAPSRLHSVIATDRRAE